VRFLVDEALSPHIARVLSAAGHDAVHAGDLGLLGRPDGEIMERASATERVVLSVDTDFGQLLALGAFTGPSVAAAPAGAT